MTFNDDNIILCVNCDSEFYVTKVDDEDMDVQYCPYCGFDMSYEEDDEYDDNEEDTDKY